MMTSNRARSTGKRPRVLAPNKVKDRVLTDDDDLTLKGEPRCHGIRAAGGRCQGFAGKSGYCFFHDPGRSDEEKFKARSISGPGNRLVKLMPPRLRPVFEDLVNAMKDLREGRMTAAQASALSALATASVRVLMSGEMEERQRRIDALLREPDDPTPPAEYDDD